MKKTIRFSLLLFIPIAILVLTGLFFTHNLNQQKKTLQGETLSAHFPIVLFSKKPDSLFPLAYRYPSVNSLFPAHQIQDSYPLWQVLNNQYNHKEAMAWLFFDFPDENPVIAIANTGTIGKRTGRAIRRRTITKRSSTSDNIIIAGEQKYYYTIVNQIVLLACDSGKLHQAEKMIKNEAKQNLPLSVITGLHPEALHHLYLNPGTIQNENPEGFPTELIPCTVGAFDLHEYNNTLHINGLSAHPDASETQNALPLTKLIPTSATIQHQRINYHTLQLDVFASATPKGQQTTLTIPQRQSSNPSVKQQSPENNNSQWVNLKTPVKKGPFLVADHTTEETRIILFDTNNTMYFFTLQGTLLWEKNFPDAIQSEIFVVDKYNNNKCQYLWNSDKLLHLTDINGDEPEGFPFPLPVETPNAINLIKTEEKTQPEILYVDKENKTHKLSLEPAEDKKWKKTKLEFPVNGKITFINHQNDRWYILAGTNGQVSMLGEDGAVRMRIKKSFCNNPNSDFYLNQTNQKGFLITTDQRGHLVYIPKKGKTSETIFSAFQAAHYFLYNDFDHDGNNDFIFIDQGKINIYNRFKTLIFSNETAKNIQFVPEIHHYNKRTILSVVDASQQQLLLYERSGALLQGKSIPCATVPAFDYSKGEVYTAREESIYKTKIYE
ncbi:MAG: hypothetical protein PHT77_08290 [Bacteroidales bacterium]|nr:hypothetical protein [Bacteroidales bacterium]MDD3961848.1 hypothetical protein [Bacteroidales bacterium]MDY0285930.1 hypothetical protein [Bacteroidales bacterium]